MANMTDPEGVHEETVRQVLDALDRVHENAIAAIDTAPDRQHAIESAARIATALRETADDIGEKRTQAALEIWEHEKLSLAGLANRMGVSKTRADQLVRAHKGARKDDS